MMDQIRLGKILGKGTRGVVYELDQEDRAIKIFRDDDNCDSEIKILQNLNHVHIEKFYSSGILDKHVYMIVEKMDLSLFDWIDFYKSNPNMSHIHINSIMRQLVSALQYLDHLGIMHRDLKPENIGLKNNVVKIIDFGSATIELDNILVCSLWYRSIEQLITLKQYNTKVDVWSLGCIYGELLKLHDPHFVTLFQGDYNPYNERISIRNQLKTICASMSIDPYSMDDARECVKRTWLENVRGDLYFMHEDANAVALLKKMVAVDPNKRINIQHMTHFND